MSLELFGNTRGLAPRQKHDLERLYRRRLDADRLISLDLARELYERASSIGRKIALLVGRDGEVLQVIVGSRERVYIPDLGRFRLGQGRLRRVRLLFSDLSSKEGQARIPSDIYGDLEKLRLDAVVSVKPIEAHNASNNDYSITYAYLDIGEDAEGASDAESITVEEPSLTGLKRFDFAAFIAEQERKLTVADRGTRDTNMVRAVAVSVRAVSQERAQSSMTELLELCRTADIKVVSQVVQRKAPDPRTVLGKGRLEEVVLLALRKDATMLIFDCELTPSQWRSVTNLAELKIIDRSMLILDIFARRASSADGRLQVELAQLKYNLPRLQEQDSGMSRLSGGIGGRGPGETKLEISRRRSKDRIAMLEKRIRDVESKRVLRSRVRSRSDIPLVSLVGYTNAGKSTLFNALTSSSVLAEDKLFATLDPTQRRISYPLPAPTLATPVDEQALSEENLTFIPSLPQLFSFILSDTVGFIRELPKELMQAFKATLDELSQASLLLHVVDASDPELADKMDAVARTLSSLELSGIPQIVVYNKVDLLDSVEVERLRVSSERGTDSEQPRSIVARVLVSSSQRDGLRELKSLIVETLHAQAVAPSPDKSASDGMPDDSYLEDDSEYVADISK